ncbi:hypothetical protein GH714_025788 [Hevea brasiliensis]|uniref:Uncharacterized protein n=1 Tax=Hevea brasiliensis TaxID=3981 RepID=A0A6A6NJ44_HEVBR|nr:hypothetical protein GH714_025788 [Hevea brasiliensis]
MGAMEVNWDLLIQRGKVDEGQAGKTYLWQSKINVYFSITNIISELNRRREQDLYLWHEEMYTMDHICDKEPMSREEKQQIQGSFDVVTESDDEEIVEDGANADVQIGDIEIVEDALFELKQGHDIEKNAIVLKYED